MKGGDAVSHVVRYSASYPAESPSAEAGAALLIKIKRAG
jgi:hypothetical protein